MKLPIPPSIFSTKTALAELALLIISLILYWIIRGDWPSDLIYGIVGWVLGLRYARWVIRVRKSDG